MAKCRLKVTQLVGLGRNSGWAQGGARARPPGPGLSGWDAGCSCTGHSRPSAWEGGGGGQARGGCRDVALEVIFQGHSAQATFSWRRVRGPAQGGSPSSCLSAGDRPDLRGFSHPAPGPTIMENGPHPKPRAAQRRGVVMGEGEQGGAPQSNTSFLAPALGVGAWGLETCDPQAPLLDPSSSSGDRSGQSPATGCGEARDSEEAGRGRLGPPLRLAWGWGGVFVGRWAGFLVGDTPPHSGEEEGGPPVTTPPPGAAVGTLHGKSRHRGCRGWGPSWFFSANYFPVKG